MLFDFIVFFEISVINTQRNKIIRLFHESIGSNPNIYHL